MKIETANGATGQLIYCMDGKYRFRVYSDDDKSFIDYDLLHSDLTVTICDEDAAFYISEGVTLLDHSPDTLGINNEQTNR